MLKYCAINMPSSIFKLNIDVPGIIVSPLLNGVLFLLLCSLALLLCLNKISFITFGITAATLFFVLFAANCSIEQFAQALHFF